MKTLWLLLGVTVVLTIAGPAMAEEAPPASADKDAATAPQEKLDTISLGGDGLKFLAGCLGAGLVIMGGTKAIGMVGGKAVESISRQPEAASQMFLAWLLPAAMIEGAMLFGVVICLMVIMR